MKNMEHFYKVLSRVDGMLSFAEAKIGFIVAYAGVLLSVLGSQAERFQTLLHSPNQIIIYVTLLLLLFMLVNLIIIFVYVHRVLNPKLEFSAHRSLTYFGDISRLTEKDFLKAARSRTEKEVVDDVLTQIHAVSNLVSHKFGNIQQATRWLYLYTLLWVLTIAMIIYFS